MSIVDPLLKEQLDRIEALVKTRKYSWRDEVTIRLACFGGYGYKDALSEVRANPVGCDVALSDEDACALRNYLIKVYGYPTEVLVPVGNPGI